MSDTAYQIQYRQEFIAGFEQKQSLLRESVTTEVEVKGQQAVFLVADSGGATAVTRGVNGLIPGRPDNLNQNTCTLAEWHDKPVRTGFNLFASQGDGKRIMQETSMGVINRKIDQDIISALITATPNTGTAAIGSLGLTLKAQTILMNNFVPDDGSITFLITPAYRAYLAQTKEFANANYVNKKPLDTGQGGWKDAPGYYEWLGLRLIVHPSLPGVGTNNETCIMYHRNAIGHAAPGELLQTAVGYNEENDYSFARCTAFMGSKLLQNSGVVLVYHDGSQLVSS